MDSKRNTVGMLIGAAIVVVAIILVVASVAHAEPGQPQQEETHGIGVTGNWPTTCAPQGMHRIVSEAKRIVQVWQETPAKDCTPVLTPWHATMQLPPGDWTVQWVIDARDGSEDRQLEFFVRDHTILRHHTFLPIVQ